MTAGLAKASKQSAGENKKAVFSALAARFGDRFSVSQALREQHANTLTWLGCEPPDAVVFAESEAEVSDVVKLCAAARMPIIPFGTGTSLEGHVNAPFGGLSLDVSRMNRIVAVHEADLDCVVEPGVTRKQLNDHLRDSGLSIQAPMPVLAAWRRRARPVPTPYAMARCAIRYSDFPSCLRTAA